MPQSSLITLKQYAKLSPFKQGFAVYMQAEWQGSELKGQCNPYPVFSRKYENWHAGQIAACLAAQDSEE